jgi:hypoxanthine phosphoribosyltransferase
MDEDISSVMVSADAIQKRVAELGEAITSDYASKELVLIWILNGALLFAADLIRNIKLPVRVDCIRVSSYKRAMRPITEPVVKHDIHLNIEGRSVLLVDDVFDTGKTLQRVVKELKALKPESIETCVLLDKKTNRTITAKPSYIGFEIPDQFVVGYGLDFAEQYRHLPYIGVLKPELQNPPEWV